MTQHLDDDDLRKFRMSTPKRLADAYKRVWEGCPCNERIKHDVKLFIPALKDVKAVKGIKHKAAKGPKSTRGGVRPAKAVARAATWWHEHAVSARDEIAERYGLGQRQRTAMRHTPTTPESAPPESEEASAPSLLPSAASAAAQQPAYCEACAQELDTSYQGEGSKYHTCGGEKDHRGHALCSIDGHSLGGAMGGKLCAADGCTRTVHGLGIGSMTGCSYQTEDDDFLCAVCAEARGYSFTENGWVEAASEHPTQRRTRRRRT